MEQGRLFASNVVSLTEFRARRLPAAGNDAPRHHLPAPPRPLTGRALEHQARMLAHLTEQARLKRG